MTKLMKYLFTIIVLMVLSSSSITAQEVVNELQMRYSAGVSTKLNDKWGVSLAPEIRFDENFNADRFLVDAKIKYKVWKYISLGGTYRFDVNFRDVKETQYLNRFAVNTTFETKINRFEPSLRVQYSNYADDEINDGKFMRYKFALEYNIKDCKLTPKITTEIFHQLGDNSRLYKMRYGAALDYKINKKNYISLGYKFDYYEYELLNKHIIELGYKYKF